MAGQLATASFDHQHPQAPDNRMQRPNLNARNEISPWIRWEGMQVYVVQEQKTYQLVGGTGNEHWQEIAAGVGASNFVGQYPTFDDLPDSGSPGDYAYVGTGDDFVQYNWDQIAEEWRLNSAETKVSDEDFYLGRVPSVTEKVLFTRRINSIIYDTDGTQSITPDKMANYIFTGEGVELVNVNYDYTGNEEFHILNRTGENLTISGSGNFATGGTIQPGHIASFKWNGTALVQSYVNEEATFSDTLDSVNVRISRGPDDLEVLSGIFDRNTGEEVQFKEYSGTPPDVDGILFVAYNSKNWIRADYLRTKKINIKDIGCKPEPDFDNSSILNYYLAIDGFNHFVVPDGVFEIFYKVDIIYRSGLLIEGPGTLKVNPEAPVRQTYIFDIADCENVTVRNITLENSGVVIPYEHATQRGHCIRIRSTSKNMLFERIHFLNAGADGIYINDISGDEECKDIIIDKCIFENVTRNGVSIINGDNITVSNCTFSYWRLCAIDVEPNSPTVHLPNRNHKIINNFFIEHQFEDQTDRSTIQCTSGSSSPSPEDIEGWGNILIERNVLVPIDVKLTNFIRSQAFPRLIVRDNSAINCSGNFILIAGAPGSIVTGNKSYQNSLLEYDSEFDLNGKIMIISSDDVVVADNELDGANFNGIRANNCNNLTVSDNKVKNIGLSEDNPGNFSYMSLQNIRNSVIKDNKLEQTTAYSSRGIYIYFSTSIDNIVEGNRIGDNIPVKSIIVNLDRNTVINNTGIKDSLTSLPEANSLPTAGEYYVGKVLRIPQNGTDKDRYFLCKKTPTGFAWEEVLTLDKKEILSGVANPNSLATWTGRYVRFTGSAGNVTILDEMFNNDDEIEGEIEGGAKTFVAGPGVTLRCPAGGTNVAPTNSRFFIKFKSPNDAQLTIVPSTVPENTYDTFIPVIHGNGSNPTLSYTEQSGYYALIDRLCHFEIRLNWQSMSGGIGNIRIPLPVARHSNTANGGPAIAVMTGLSTLPPIYACYSGFNNIGFRDADGNDIYVSDLESEGVIALSGTYIIGG